MRAFFQRYLELHRRRPSTARYFFRPLAEQLESRELLAFDLTISLAATFGVSTLALGGTTTFSANATGAHLSVNDINAALAAGNSVVVTSGGSGTEAGNISTSGFFSRTFSNAARTRLTIQSGSGTNLVGNVSLADLRFNGDLSSVVVQAANNVSIGMLDSLDGGPLASVILVGGGTVSLNSAVTAGAVRLKAAGNISQTANGIITADALGAHSTAGDVDLDTAVNATEQFVARTDGENHFVEFQNGHGFATGQVTSSDPFKATVTGVTTNGGPITLVAASGNLTVGTAGVANSGINTGTEGSVVRLQATAGGVSQAAEGTIVSRSLGVRALGAVALAAAANDSTYLAVRANGKVDYRNVGDLIILMVEARGVFTEDVFCIQSGGNDVSLLIGGNLNLRDTSIPTLITHRPIDAGATGDVRIVAGGTVVQVANSAANLQADELGIRAGGVVAVDDDIFVNKLAIFTSEEVRVNARNPLLVETIGVTVGTIGAADPNPIGWVSTTGIDAGRRKIVLYGGPYYLASGNVLGDQSTVTLVDSEVVLAVGEETIGGLSGGGTVTFPADGQEQQLIVGGNNQDWSFFGDLDGGFAPDSVDRFVKQGTGALTLGGSSPLAVDVQVSAGTLLVTGSLTTVSSVDVSAGAALGGTGAINGPVNIEAGGHLAPGTSTGILRTGNLTLSAGSAFDAEITSGVQYDVVVVNGPMAIATTGDGVALNIAKFGSVDLRDGDQLFVVNNVDANEQVQGTFKDLPEGKNLGANFLGTGQSATITYQGNDGNDVVLLISPGSFFPWHNPDEALDAVGSGANPPADGAIAAGDAVAIINYINGFGAGAIPANAVIGEPFGFLDTAGGVNGGGDNSVAPNDALAVINAINAGQGGEGEPTTDAQPLSSSAQSVLNELIGLLAIDVASQPKRRR